MKKIVITVLIVSILCISGISYADSPIRKLGRGLANVATCVLEVPIRINEANEESGPIAAITWGVVNGLYRTCLRAVVGIYEVGTFIIPYPAHYEPIITDPEFFFEDMLV